MKKYSTPAYIDGENGETVFGSVDVYLASDADARIFDADARIAELEEFIKVLLPSWPDGEHYPTEMSLLQMKQERIAELEKALRRISELDCAYAATNGAAYDAVQIAKSVL